MRFVPFFISYFLGRSFITNEVVPFTQISKVKCIS